MNQSSLFAVVGATMKSASPLSLFRVKGDDDGSRQLRRHRCQDSLPRHLAHATHLTALLVRFVSGERPPYLRQLPRYVSPLSCLILYRLVLIDNPLSSARHTCIANTPSPTS